MSSLIPPFAHRPIHVCAVLLITGSFFIAPRLSGQPRIPSACLPPEAQEQLLRRETALLGKVHAQEHATARMQQCEAERGTRPVPARGVASAPQTTLQEDAAVVQAATAAATGATSTSNRQAQQAANTASKVGRWSSPFVIQS